MTSWPKVGDNGESGVMTVVLVTLVFLWEMEIIKMNKQKPLQE
jgi:hypothetical protein